MIRYLTDKERTGSRDLWEEAFPEDSRPFDDYYFSEKIKDNKILVLENEQKGIPRIDAMIHLNPYAVQAAGMRWQVDYLVGVATRKDRRHQGCMRRLLTHMMEDMRDEGMPFCFLMPADAAIYQPFGFTYIFRKPVMGLREGVRLQEREILEKEISGKKILKREIPGKEGLTGLAFWMNCWLASRYEVFAVRDADYVRRLLLEVASEDGNFRLLYDQDIWNARNGQKDNSNDQDGPDNQKKPAGMVSEWGLEKREQRLLYCEDAYVEEKAPAKPAIMARIISPETFVKAVRLEESDDREQVTVSLNLTDPQIERNDRCWLWHLNRNESWMEPWDGDQAELSLTIEELTFWLFGYGMPEAVKKAGLERAVRTLRGVFLDEVV